MNFEYEVEYDSLLLRGIDDPTTPRPWDLSKEILRYAHPHKTLLDIGCGTGFKLVYLSSYFKEITGLDVKFNMLSRAKKIFKKNQVCNIKVIQGNGYVLPFKPHQFDVVTCMLSRWSVEEIFRVLKPGGVVIIEHPSCEDKKNFKLLFGRDKEGWRGQYLNDEKEHFLDNYLKIFKKFFREVTIQNGFWNTFYTEQGILELLEYTPAIRGFNKTLDAQTIENGIKQFHTENGIRLEQNRILICAKNT